ncbi:hypothetical protein [Sulfurimonas sp.]|uniref:hypothetical protein n=1 Tax=Sulfurimonas sp. TaxID=2022749 RepID=UPI0025DBB7DF|nr:hypothetical protein [Sulfurimonas sp.]
MNKNKKLAKKAFFEAQKVKKSVAGTVTKRVGNLEQKSHSHTNLTDLNNLNLVLLQKFSEVDGKLYFNDMEVSYNVNP